MIVTIVMIMMDDSRGGNGNDDKENMDDSLWTMRVNMGSL